MMAKPVNVEMKLCELLADRPGRFTELALAARNEVLRLAPECSELLYRSYAVSDVFSYTHKLGQAFIHIATYSGHVNLGFNRGANLKDPKKVLKGSGKLIRHIRLESVETLALPAVRALMKEAIAEGRSQAESRGGIQPACFIDNTQ